MCWGSVACKYQLNYQKSSKSDKLKNYHFPERLPMGKINFAGEPLRGASSSDISNVSLATYPGVSLSRKLINTFFVQLLKPQQHLFSNASTTLTNASKITSDSFTQAYPGSRGHCVSSDQRTRARSGPVVLYHLKPADPLTMGGSSTGRSTQAVRPSGSHGSRPGLTTTAGRKHLGVAKSAKPNKTSHGDLIKQDSRAIPIYTR